MARIHRTPLLLWTGAAFLSIAVLSDGKEKPLFPPNDHVTSSPLIAWTDLGVMNGGKPDTQIMVSKTHVVLVTTEDVGFFEKGGAKLSVVPTTDFFVNNKTKMPDGTLMSDFLAANKGAKPAWGFGDCKAVYDPYRERFWFLATFNNAYPGDGRMFWGIAVSNGGDPTKGWRTFVVPAHRRDDKRYTNSDFPTIGIDQEAFYASIWVYVGNPVIEKEGYWYVLALKAAEIATGKDLNATNMAEITNWIDPQKHKRLTRSTLTPSASTAVGDASSGTKFVGRLDDSTVGIWALRNPFSTHPEILSWTVPVAAKGPYATGTKPKQKGTDVLIDDNFGDAIVSVVQQGPDLYLASQDVTYYGTDKQPYTAVHFTRVTSPGPFGKAPPRVTADITFGAHSPEERGLKFNYLHPSLMVNKFGDAVVVMNSTGETIYPEARAATIYHDRTTADWSALVKSGEAPVTLSPNKEKYTEWGDIARAALDPEDNVGMWVATQFGTTDHYRLAIGKFLSAQTARIVDGWPGVWANTVQAATAWPNGKIYLFRGSEYIRFDITKNKADPGYPQPIVPAWHGVWPDGIDAVAVWPNGKAFFFRGGQYIQYDIAKDKADDGYPKSIAGRWAGVWKEGIDAVVVWPNGKAYFFRGDQYISYDIKTDKSDPGFPKPIRNDWPGLWVDGVDAGVTVPDGKAYFFKRGDYFHGRVSTLPAHLISGN